MTTRLNSVCDYDRVDTVLGAFTKLRKATISFAMSALVSVRIEPLGSHRTDIREIWCLSIFRKSVEIIHVALKIRQE